MLAAEILRRQGVDVVALTFTSPFFGHTAGVTAAGRLGVEHHVVDIAEDAIACVRSPRHGYGRHMNPCIDCHAMMVRNAKSLMADHGASFVVTGEVLGERPKSQNLAALRLVEEDGELPGLVLRPLSARLLPETVPEREGWVDRERLHAMNGRSRVPQFALAEELGLKEYPTPGGGCRLTLPSFSARLRALLQRHADADSRAFLLLSLGRHRWVGDGLVVVGRNKEENHKLRELGAPGDRLVWPASDRGPTTLVRWGGEDALAAGLAMTARYGQERDESEVVMVVLDVASGVERRTISTDHGRLQDYRLVE